MPRPRTSTRPKAAYFREYQRRWMRERREVYFAGKACAHCAAIDGLTLDHVDPAQKVSHRIWSWSAKRLADELAKCQPLCAPCHRAKSSKDWRDRFGSKGEKRSRGAGARFIAQAPAPEVRS